MEQKPSREGIALHCSPNLFFALHVVAFKRSSRKKTPNLGLRAIVPVRYSALSLNVGPLATALTTLPLPRSLDYKILPAACYSLCSSVISRGLVHVCPHVDFQSISCKLGRRLRYSAHCRHPGDRF